MLGEKNTEDAHSSGAMTVWSIAFLTSVALVAGVIVSGIATGVCSENVDEGTFRGDVCGALGGDGSRAAIALAPAGIVLIVGLVGRRKRPTLLALIGLLVLEAVALALLTAAGS
ncbi:MAG: hypothetical protein IT201_01830 [Thermoleophilia bacterium]|nr:hypothetical protein [Thermoleophilia bacterium]